MNMILREIIDTHNMVVRYLLPHMTALTSKSSLLPEISNLAYVILCYTQCMSTRPSALLLYASYAGAPHKPLCHAVCHQ